MPIIQFIKNKMFVNGAMVKEYSKKKPTNESIKLAIHRILDYLEDDERKNLNELLLDTVTAEEADTEIERHIYSDILKVRKFLKCAG